MRDTKRIEFLLEGTQEIRKQVREEILAGASLQHVHDELLVHEQIFTERLKELNAFNAAEKETARLASLKPNGPTLVEFVKAGYAIENYPPLDYAPIPYSQEQLAEAQEIIAARAEKAAAEKAEAIAAAAKEAADKAEAEAKTVADKEAQEKAEAEQKAAAEGGNSGPNQNRNPKNRR